MSDLLFCFAKLLPGFAWPGLCLALLGFAYCFAV
jgi:hypothetical protein